VLSNQFTTSFDASYTNITRDLRDAGWLSDYSTTPLASTNALALIKSPFLSPYAFSTDGRESSFLASADNYLYEVLGDNPSLANPKHILDEGEAKNKNHTDLTHINLVIAPKWQPSKNFSLTERFSYTMQSFDESYFTPRDGMPARLYEGKEALTRNTKNSLFTQHNGVFSDTRADWAIPMGEHRLDIFGGVRFMNDTYHSSALMGDNTAGNKTPNSTSSQTSKQTPGTDIDWRSMTYYANVDYNYKEKYYVQAALAMETSSRYGKDVDAGLKLFGVPWAFFPSIQGAWVMTNEDWFKPNNGINFLKLNVGFESVGNDDIDNSATLTYMKAGSFLGESMPFIQFANVGNPELRWETTNRINAGLEGNFFQNRLNVKFNVFKSWTNNLISMGTLAYVAGLSDYLTNDGKLENAGFDVAFNAKVLNLPKFKAEVGGSLGHYKNEITQLPQNVQFADMDIYGGTIRTQVGQPAGVFYGYKTDGVFATSEDAARSGLYVTDNTNAKTYFKAGDIRFQNLSGNDGEINEADRTIIGDPNPDIYGNFYANFYIHKHWKVAFNFTYSLGNDIYNYQRSILESGSQFMNQTTALNRRWMAEGQQTDVPNVVYGDPMGNSRFSDRWIEDGSYLKLKNVTVSYQLPIQNEYIQGLTVWAAANNLFTITKYLGNDPEVCAGNSVLLQGIDAGFLNYGRSFTLGVKINL
jgi:TonB-linked SusC/RagA family outer membrane protein